MEKSKFYLGMIVLALAMMVIGCGDKSSPNNFEGKSFDMNDKSTLKFDKTTWTWDNHVMDDSTGVSTIWQFRGNYTCSDKGNTATMISTDYYVNSAWVPWKGQWTATLDGTSLTVTYNGAVNKSIISLEELTVELEGYQVK